MFARVSTYEGQADDYDAGLDEVSSDLAPKVRAMPGSAGLLSLINRDTGQSLSITLWDSEEAMVNSREAANRVRSQAATSTGSTIVGVTEYEVGFADLSQVT
jgi:heme-degrading monooxygenase HmoA